MKHQDKPYTHIQYNMKQYDVQKLKIKYLKQTSIFQFFQNIQFFHRGKRFFLKLFKFSSLLLLSRLRFEVIRLIGICFCVEFPNPP